MYMTAMLFSLLLLITGIIPPVNEQVRTYRGNARETGTGRFLYSENNEELLKGGKLVKTTTRYRAPNGDVISERVMNFQDDLTKPDFVLKDFRVGYQEGARRISGNTIRVFYRDDFKSKVEEKTIRVEEPYVMDGGLSHYFRQNWKKLMDGEVLVFQFVVPAKLDYFRFRVSKSDIIKIGGRTGMKLKLETNNFVLRAILDPIYITYALDDRSILAYEGVSNVVSEAGKNYNVFIDYPKDQR